MALSLEQKLSRKDANLRRFIQLSLDIAGRLDDATDAEYVRRYARGLLAGGNTWAGAEEHFISGIFMKLVVLRKTDRAAAEAFALAEAWLKKHKFL